MPRRELPPSVSSELQPFLGKDGRIDAHRVESDLLAALEKIRDVHIDSYPLDYGMGQIFHFIRVVSNGIWSGEKVVTMRAGIHANELSGVFTWLQSAKEIFRYARSRGVKLIVYPLANPSGIAQVEGYPDVNPDHRYNIIDNRGSQGAGNNDFLRYKVKGSEELLDDLGNGREYEKWFLASEVHGARLPLETQMMHQRVKEDLASDARILGVIDMHQDLITEKVGVGAYYYPMEEDTSPYRPSIAQIQSLGVPMLRNFTISAGYVNGQAITSDNTGGIFRYD